MLRLFSFIFIFVFCLLSKAQVTGVVIDSRSRQPLDFVNVYYDGKKIIRATGKMHGTITDKEYPGNGFGFDSIFRLNDKRIVSQLSKEEKNSLSHRYQASIKLKEKLKNCRN